MAARAWIVADAGDGRVLEAGNERTPLPPASLTKVVTALAAVEALDPADGVPVTPRAEGMPARKINMKAGQVWPFPDALHAMLLSSANDAAFALAERTSGSIEGFEPALGALARRLGFQDDYVLRDPSGLDDHFSVGGGNVISARDLAIATRAALAQPEIAGAVARPEYRFTGPDGVPHRLVNHNRLLRTYSGAIGVKTGYTRRAGRCLIAAATRAGRTLIAVVLGAPDTYGAATALLDRGFASTTGTSAVGDRLPSPLPASARTGAAGSSGATSDETATVEGIARRAIGTHAGSDRRWWRSPLLSVPGAMVGTVAFLRLRVLLRATRRRRHGGGPQPVPRTPDQS